MKPGAQLIIKDINAANPLVLFNKIHDLVFAGEIGNEMSFARLKEFLINKGFTIQSSTKKTMYVYPHFTIVAEK